MYRRVPSRHFLFTSSDTFAVICIVQPQQTVKTRNVEISACGITLGSVVTRPRIIRDVVLGLGPWSLVVLKDKISVLGPAFGLEPPVLGPVLGLAC